MTVPTTKQHQHTHYTVKKYSQTINNCDIMRLLDTAKSIVTPTVLANNIMQDKQRQ